MIVETVTNISILKVFLERSGARAINSGSLNPPNPNCPACSSVLARVEIDPEIATLEHLIRDVLQTQLGYDDEISIRIGSEEIYDPDFTDNLPRKLSDFGIKNNSFLTVTDENDENIRDTRVNLDVVIIER